MAGAEGRVWGGLTAQERAANRRARFFEAGLELFAAKGWDKVTVLDICRGARLSQRYFYEQFPSREALFTGLMDHIAAEVEQVVRDGLAAPAETAEQRAGSVLAALADFFAADPRKVRVALVESLASPEFRGHRAALLAAFTALASRLMAGLRPDPADADPRTLELSAFVVSGGLVEALIAGVTDERVPWTRDELVAHLTRLYSAAARL